MTAGNLGFMVALLLAVGVLGLFAGFKPRFVKRYAELGEQVSAAAAEYAADVRARRFPGPEHLFGAAPPSDPAAG